jgi:energy-coupling factor transporter ATP-binding protein EcfA2
MAILFTVISVGQVSPKPEMETAYLLEDNWDDWFAYSTMYTLKVCDAKGVMHRIGSVKIGQAGMRPDQRRPDLEPSFERLGEEFFSLGQDDTYYESLNQLGAELRDQVLTGLCDMAFDPQRLETALKEKVTGVSLLRSVTRATVQGQYARLAQGGVRLSRYNFTYAGPRKPRSTAPSIELTFVVEPESMPPSNIHVLIGRNGVGKTYLLNNMSRSLVEQSSSPEQVGAFEGGEANQGQDLFANLVSVTFSAFDPFEPLPNRRDRSEGLPCAYVGLKRIGTTSDGKPLAPKSPDSLSREFSASILVCRSQSARLSRWRRALHMLEADPIFKAADVVSLADEELEADADMDALKARARKLFSNLSSGHKIVLLTITRLVETVEERTLVLLDEPEAHLHPPLLSAFVRALSDLLVNRNGVAIVATHSPVIIQEVPSQCVWKIWRNGRIVQAERPTIETFGENVGVLTREVFGLEVTDAGFHQLLREATRDEEDFDEVVAKFDRKLGGEARALIRALMVNRRDGQ